MSQHGKLLSLSSNVIVLTDTRTHTGRSDCSTRTNKAAGNKTRESSLFGRRPGQPAAGVTSRKTNHSWSRRRRNARKTRHLCISCMHDWCKRNYNAPLQLDTITFAALANDNRIIQRLIYVRIFQYAFIFKHYTCEDLLPLRILKILNFPENFENGSVKIGKGTAPRFFHNIPM